MKHMPHKVRQICRKCGHTALSRTSEQNAPDRHYDECPKCLDPAKEKELQRQNNRYQRSYTLHL